MTPQQRAFLKTALVVLVALHLIAGLTILVARLIAARADADRRVGAAAPVSAMCRAGSRVGEPPAAEAQRSNLSFSLSPGS